MILGTWKHLDEIPKSTTARHLDNFNPQNRNSDMTHMSEISIGLIGAGMMGQEHIQNFNPLDGVRISAIADTHAGMRDKAAAMPAQSQAVDDFGKLLGDPDLDALLKHTEFSSHRCFASGAGNRQADFVRETSVHHAGRYA